MTVPSHPAPDPQASPRARPRVLLLTHRLPYPPDRGDRIRAYHLLRGLAGRCDVTLASVSEQTPTFAQMRALQAEARDVLFQRIGPTAQRLRGVAAMLRGDAGTPAAHFHRGLAKRLIDRHRAEPFDAVVTFCTGMLHYTRALRACGGDPFRHVLDLVDVDSAKWGRYARQARGPMRRVYATECLRLRRYESGEAVAADAVSVISERERRVYGRTVARGGVKPPVVVAGNGVDLQHFAPGVSDLQDDTPACVFTGVLSYKPNADAVHWFAHRVLPQVRRAVPAARFQIVGQSPGAAVCALSQLPGVEVVGPVADTRPYLHRAAVAVAPLAIAPGVQNKVLEAMACARPVVCSPAAARGIDAQPGRDLLTASDPATFARTVIRLLTGTHEAGRLGAAGRTCVEARYTWARALAPLVDLVAPNTTAIPDEIHGFSLPASTARAA